MFKAANQSSTATDAMASTRAMRKPSITSIRDQPNTHAILAMVARMVTACQVNFLGAIIMTPSIGMLSLTANSHMARSGTKRGRHIACLLNRSTPNPSLSTLAFMPRTPVYVVSPSPAVQRVD